MISKDGKWQNLLEVNAECLIHPLFDKGGSMRGLLIKTCLALALVGFNEVHTVSAIRNIGKDEWGGRLGDMLFGYVKARWLAHHYNLLFLYEPFNYSDQLALHDNNLRYKELKSRGFTEIDVKDASMLGNIKSRDNMIYRVNYYFQLDHWGDYQKKYDSQEIMAWPEVYTDEQFLSELKKDIAPRDGRTILLDLPTDKITVAVHMRMGGGFDHPLISHQFYDMNTLNSSERIPQGIFSDWYWPLKFPPLQYYATQLERLSDLYNNQPMYVYIYTDSQDPVSLMNVIERSVNRSNITFDCRKEINRHDMNVLEDIFAIAQYQCLIRSGSNYPQISQLIGNHKIVIYPKSAVWVGKTLVINDVGTFTRGSLN